MQCNAVQQKTDFFVNYKCARLLKVKNESSLGDHLSPFLLMERLNRGLIFDTHLLPMTLLFVAVLSVIVVAKNPHRHGLYLNK
jgi:hypothetical protein